MANKKIIPEFDNIRCMGFDKGIPHVKEFVLREIPQLRLMGEYKQNSGYWGLTLAVQRFNVFIGFDRGSLDYKISMDDKDIYLVILYPELPSFMVVSEINVNNVLLIFK